MNEISNITFSKTIHALKDELWMYKKRELRETSNSKKLVRHYKRTVKSKKQNQWHIFLEPLTRNPHTPQHIIHEMCQKADASLLEILALNCNHEEEFNFIVDNPHVNDDVAFIILYKFPLKKWLEKFSDCEDLRVQLLVVSESYENDYYDLLEKIWEKLNKKVPAKNTQYNSDSVMRFLIAHSFSMSEKGDDWPQEWVEAHYGTKLDDDAYLIAFNTHDKMMDIYASQLGIR